MYWDKVLNEVLNKNSSKPAFEFTNLSEFKKHKQLNNNSDFHLNDHGKIKKMKRPAKRYALGDKYQSVYFTEREAQCMVLLMKGKTIAKVAEELFLSPRTIEFYLKNMKYKIGCRTKFDLIDVIQSTGFLQQVDF
jgi:DNA-binding CsgD family transcriptional regulator